MILLLATNNKSRELADADLSFKHYCDVPAVRRYFDRTRMEQKHQGIHVKAASTKGATQFVLTYSMGKSSMI
jgi:hypothetical protein